MRDQITALHVPEFYKLDFLNQLSWLPGCYGNERFLPFHSSYHSNHNYKYYFTFGSPDLDISALGMNTICVHISWVSMEISYCM